MRPSLPADRKRQRSHLQQLLFRRRQLFAEQLQPDHQRRGFQYGQRKLPLPGGFRTGNHCTAGHFSVSGQRFLHGENQFGNPDQAELYRKSHQHMESQGQLRLHTVRCLQHQGHRYQGFLHQIRRCCIIFRRTEIHHRQQHADLCGNCLYSTVFDRQL